MSKVNCVLFVFCAVSVGLSTAVESTPNDFNLVSNASIVNGGPIVYGFSCDGLAYGYYADVSNGCRVFHICYPQQDAEQFVVTRMWSFICGLGTVFNQEALVCDYPQNSIPCEESQNYYNVNEYFGRLDVNFREWAIMYMCENDLWILVIYVYLI